ncbi:MAG: DegT/DnrJ/EryC1/StrS family aminotransferase [Oscillospiraceae bacterium]|nr:DegT/DnrJ/EryC1/StrS family aminotransferase [Oscillospiraceae bacterium]
MVVPFLDLKRQYEELRAEIEPVVIDVLRGGAYIGGKYVEAFESEMRKYLGVKHVVSCANGTDALIIALHACGVQPGDEVITSPFSFFATAEAIAVIGATPVFVDVKDSDYNIDPARIEAKITPKTRALLPVHIFGQPCNLDAIRRIAKEHSLCAIEDAAQAIGSEYKGKKIGVTDAFACFSFYPTKNLGAFGDAGMLTTDNDDLAIIAKALCEHGMGSNGAKARELLYGVRDEFSTTASPDPLYNPYKYYNYVVGYNSRLDALQAAILSVKLKHLDEYNEKRRKIAAMYGEGLGDIVKTPAPQPMNQSKSCYHQYAICTEKKDALGEFLAKRGIGTGAFYPVPLHLQKAFSGFRYRKGSFPAAESLSRKTVCLPIFPELSEDEVKAVIQAVRDFVREQA